MRDEVVSRSQILFRESSSVCTISSSRSMVDLLDSSMRELSLFSTETVEETEYVACKFVSDMSESEVISVESGCRLRGALRTDGTGHLSAG